MTISTLQEKCRPIRILLVEDNYGDALLTKKAFSKIQLETSISIAEDGEKAIARLTRQGEFADQPLPDMVLLDINLPKLNGKEVLAKVKKNPSLSHIPVIIFTSSAAEMDVMRSYQLQANAYMVKPANLSRFEEIVNGIEAFWFKLAVLPDEEDYLSYQQH